MTPGDTVVAELASPQTWELILAVALFGALGGIAQHLVVRDPQEVATRRWVAAVVGIVAALGVLWAAPATTAAAQIGQALLAGFFGRSVLAALQLRIIAAVEKDRRERATAIARESLALLERRTARLDGDSAPATDRETAVLRARLTELEPCRRIQEAP